MADETTVVAESSPAPETAPIEIPKSGTEEYAKWRVSGDLPEPKPKAESAPAPQAEPGEAAAPPKQQERRKPDAEARIKELTDESKRLRAELEEARRPKSEPKAEPKPAPVQATTQEPRPDDLKPDGTPKYDTYEDYTKALARWEVRQELADHEREKAQRTQNEEVVARVKQAEERYPDFKEFAIPAVKAIVSDPEIPHVIKQLMNDSDVWAELVYTVGKDPADLAEFIKMAKATPGKAIRYLALTENLIAEELDKGTVSRGTPRDETGKFTTPEPAPAKRGPESAPEPPLEVGNRGTGPADETAKALSDMERGDPHAFRRWKDAEDRKDLARLRGA